MHLPIRAVLLNENKEPVSPLLTLRQLTIWARENFLRPDPITSNFASCPVFRDWESKMYFVVRQEVADAMQTVRLTKLKSSTRLIVPGR